MRKILALLACAALILSALAFTSCGKTLEYKDGYYYCSQNDVTYQMVSFEYIPVAIGDEYATLTDGLIENKLYEIQGAEPERWLSTKDGNLFCAVGEKIPTIEEMEVKSILVCYESVAVVAVANIKSADDVASVLDNFKNGDTLEYPVGKENNEFLRLRMVSDKYPWLYFNLSYVEFAEEICEYDYPADMSEYEYRDVSDEVKVEVYDEFECWYAVGSKSEEAEYISIAQKSDVDYYTVKKANGDGTFTDYVRFVFTEEKTAEECVDKIIKNYKNGSLTEGMLHSKLDDPDKAEKINIVKYNYGTRFIYDRVSGKCVMADDTVYKYINGAPAETDDK